MSKYKDVMPLLRTHPSLGVLFLTRQGQILIDCRATERQTW
jgi:hypothetical protein